MRILSIDQAATASGWSYWVDDKPIKWGIVYPQPKNSKGGARLSSLRKAFKELLTSYPADIVLIENPVGGEEDKKGPENNWLTMQVLCQVQGVLLQVIDELNLKVEIISPSSWQFTCKIHKRDRSGRKAGAKAFVETTYKITDIEQDVCDSICICFHYLNNSGPPEEKSAF